MRKAFVLMVLCGIFSCDFGVGSALADQASPAVQKRKIVRPCRGPECGPHAACGARCRVPCPDGASCYSLYGAYGPYGGTPYWGAYTYSGWGTRW
jgi:hypothetical protein